MAPETLLTRRVIESESPSAGLRQAASAEVIVFGGGLPDPVTHPVEAIGRLTAEALAGNEARVLGYGYEFGDARLREIIAARDGAAIGADNVVLTNGSSGAIGLVAMALLEAGDVVVAEELTYAGALKAFRQMGASIATAPMDAEGLEPQGLAVVLERLAAEGRRVKFIYTIATCHNPTATILSLERRREVLRLAKRHGALVVQDDTYGDLRFTDDGPPPFIALDAERSVHLGSFSKTIAPGLRVGWAAARPEIAAAFARGRIDLGTSPILQRVVARFIDDGLFDPHLTKAVALYRRKRDLMLAALERHCRGLAEWRTPDGGFFIWLKLTRGEADAALDAGEREGVTLLPGPYFSADAPFNRHLRLSYGQIAEDRIEEGISRLGRALRQSAQS